MKYVNPTYKLESVETSDIILASGIKLEGGAILNEIDESTAQVSTSVNDILGLR